jgi:molybdopterin molybdotransferase
MTKPFLHVVRPEEVRELLSQFDALDLEEVCTEDALHRVIGKPVIAREELPSFDRATMDGFVVRAADTFGASESAPALFRIVGEVTMGAVVDRSPGRGEALRIWTGGALPPGCDAVVMVEHTEELDGNSVEVLRAVAPFENVVRKGEDCRAEETLLSPGHRLRPQDLGLLAAMGISSIVAHRKPVIAVASSGDEIVSIEDETPAGCMRDVNRHTLTAMVQESYALPIWLGIAADHLPDISSLIDRGLQQADLVLISGGSSMGSRDLVIETIKSRLDSRILVHGVSISPGKPLIVARVGDKAVFGLPGHPVSAMVCFEHFVVPLMRRLEGEDVVAPYLRPTVSAVLGRNVASREGRTDYVRVRLQQTADGMVAIPVLAKSGMISGMVRAQGFVRIEPDCEGLYKGEQVTVHLFSNWIEDRRAQKYLSGHEAAGGRAGHFLETPQQERLSRV